MWSHLAASKIREMQSCCWMAMCPILFLREKGKIDVRRKLNSLLLAIVWGTHLRKAREQGALRRE